MEDLQATYTTTTEVAKLLRMNAKAAGLLVRQGKIPAVKIANRWLVPKAYVEEMAKTYVPHRGRPKMTPDGERRQK
ncbi:MAG: helix-turn-helix domain-containing protein [Chloroflexota bacterium]